MFTNILAKQQLVKFKTENVEQPTAFVNIWHNYAYFIIASTVPYCRTVSLLQEVKDASLACVRDLRNSIENSLTSGLSDKNHVSKRTCVLRII